MHNNPARWLTAACLLVLSGCSQLPASLPPGGPGFSAADLSAYMTRMSASDADALRAETQRLNAASADNPEDRLKLAWLLSLDGFGPDERTRGQALLAGLDDGFQDPLLREYARLLRLTLGQDAQLRKERQRGEELQTKIDRLKDLEKTLLDMPKPRAPAKP